MQKINFIPTKTNTVSNQMKVLAEEENEKILDLSV